MVTARAPWGAHELMGDATVGSGATAMRTVTRSRRGGAVAVVLALGIAAVATNGVGANTGAKQPTGEPIKVGMVTIETPGIASPQAEQSYRAYFDEVNNRGGIDNRPVQLILKDGGINPARQLAATEALIDEGVVMFISGLAECKPSLNAYRQAKIFVTGGVPDCYDPVVHMPNARLDAGRENGGTNSGG